MARSRREKSESVSSATAPAVNGLMPPPSPPSPSRSSPTTTRRKASSSGRAVSSGSTTSPPKSSHAPAKSSSRQFALAVLISLGAEAAALSVASQLVTGELASISKPDPSLFEAGGLILWKIVLLGICWFSGYDAVDVASLNTLLQTPIFILLHYFYLISAPTLVVECSVSILSQALPFYILRPLSAPHSASSRTNAKLRNRIIIFDPVTTLATSAIATVVYMSILYFTFHKILPEFLAYHFEGIRSFELAHNIASTLPTLVMWLAPAGIATTQFLFRPAEGASSSSSTATGPNSIALTRSHFDPVTASLVQHFYYNFWGWYTSRQKELVGRTITLTTLLLAEILIYLGGTVSGVDTVGAFGYALLWTTGALFLGITLDWVGGPSD